MVGFILFTLGLLGTLDFFNFFGQRTVFGMFSVFGPVMIASGLFITIGKLIPKTVLVLGLIMLAIGGFPWMYTPYLLGLKGGNEGSGMMGTIIFILIGLPGLVTTIMGLFWVFLYRE